MRLVDITVETVKGTYEGKEYDFDRYNVEQRSPMATHESSVVVDALTGEITGDCIRYGSWGDLELEECLELLKIVEAEGKLLRPYK